MKKNRLLSLLLALAMLLSLCTAAFAEDAEVLEAVAVQEETAEVVEEAQIEEIVEEEIVEAEESADVIEEELVLPEEEEVAEEATETVDEPAETVEEQEPAVDKSALNAALEAAAGLDESAYTAESWAAFQGVVSVAQAVVNDEAATQTQVDEQVVALGDAQGKLESAPYAGYVLMNIPYTAFYSKVVGASNASAIDAITSATGKKAAYFWDSSYKGNAEVAYGEGATIKGVQFPVAIAQEDLAKLNADLGASEAYHYSVLYKAPKLYVNASVSESGSVSFGSLNAQPVALEGAEVTVEENTKHGDYMLKIDNDGGVLTKASKSSFEVYGVVLHTADKEYPLYHLENLYYKDFHEIAFCTKSETTQKGLNVHTDYFADLEGAVVTGLTYYTNSGIYTISTNVKIGGSGKEFNGYVLMNIPYEKFYAAETAAVGDIDALTSATNKTGNYGKAGGVYHNGKTASVDEAGNVTAVGGANGARVQGVTWAVKADSLDAVKALGGVEITDESTVTVATLGRGATSSNTLVGYQALTEAPAYSYYLLDSVPANYVSLSGGSFAAGSNSVNAQSAIVPGVSYGTNWGDVQLNLSEATEASGKLVNAVVLTAEDGTTVGLVQLGNIWSSADVAWKVASVSGLDGKKLTNVRYYCSVQDGDLTDGNAPAYKNYVIDYPVEVEIAQVYTGEVTAKFTDKNTIQLTGLPSDVQNPTAKVYHTTGGRNATYTYLTPLAVDPADDDIDPVWVKVVNGKIDITAGEATNKAGITQTYGVPIDGTTYVVELSSDNYIIHKASAEYSESALVEPVAPKKVAFADKTVSVNLGETVALKVVYTPENAGSELTWKTSKAKVATVDNGVVTAVAEGSAKITVTTANKKKASVTVKVVDPNKVTKIAFASKTVTIDKGGEAVQLVPTITPAGANTTLTWKSAKPAIATVDSEGKVIGVAEGKAKITVTAPSGKKATVTVKVVDPKIATGVKLDQSGTITLKVGETATVTATVVPATAETTLTWKSSKAKVATITDGVITAVSAGSAKVTVTTANGKKATIKVKVTK
ncbi:MAG: Ig-like domain-containing protein [Clostridia bacterium]|nr:Ig-like domain-containing protein [Clostridia bacterium]